MNSLVMIDQQRAHDENIHSAAVPSTIRPLHPPPAQPLPDSNGALKTLNIRSSSDRLHAWLLSIPNLRLKELIGSTNQILLLYYQGNNLILMFDMHVLCC